MLTKSEFCKSIVEKECEMLGLERSKAHIGIYQSSSLAVALDYLGELNAIESEYAQSRGGILHHYIDTQDDKPIGCYYLTVRELIELLPGDYDHSDEHWD